MKAPNSLLANISVSKGGGGWDNTKNLHRINGSLQYDLLSLICAGL